MRAVVVGAGLAGLAAGLELRGRGCHVTLVERSRLLGGKCTSFVVDGDEVDCGQHVHLGCFTSYTQLVGEVGMSDALTMQDRLSVVVVDRGRRAELQALPLPAPLHLLPALARFRALTPVERFRVGVALLAARARRPDAEHDQTITEWLVAHGQGSEAMRAFWSPFLVPALNAGLDEVSAAEGLFVVRTAFLGTARASRIGWARVPLARIAEAAAARMDRVLTHTAVTAITGDTGGVTGVCLDSGEIIEADAVVLAVPPMRLARVLATPARWGVAGLETLRARPIVDVHLRFAAPVDLGAGLVALLGSPVQWAFAKAPDHVVCSLSDAAEFVRRPETQLVDLATSELRAAIPAIAGIPVRAGAATRDSEATHIPPPGMRRPGWRTVAPNLTLAGAWTHTGWPATMEAAVRSGRRAGAAVQLGTPA